MEPEPASLWTEYIRGGYQPPGKVAIGHVCGALERLGFVEIKRSRNNSRYLFLPGRAPWAVRISDHQWPANAWLKYPHVVASCVISTKIQNGNAADIVAVRCRALYLAKIEQRVSR